MLIVKDKIPNATIQIPSPPSLTEELAASELQKYIFKISGGRLPVITQLRDTFLCRLVVADLSRHPGALDGQDVKAEGEFTLVRERNTVWMLGATGDALLNGVYAVLREPPAEVRVCMPGENGESANRVGTLDFPPPGGVSVRSRRHALGLFFPENDFEARGEVPSPLRVSLIDWAAKTGFGGISFVNPTVSPQLLRGAGLLEAFRRMMDTEWATDLEYWMDRSDARIMARAEDQASGAQADAAPESRFLIPFCTADDNAAAQVAKRILKTLRGNDAIRSIRLEPGPGREVCRCERCMKLDRFGPAEATDPPTRGGFPFGGNPRDHNKTLRYALFINDVAERVLAGGNGLRLGAVFAGATLGPPKGCELHPGVEPVIDLGGRCFSHGINEVGRCRINKDYWGALKEWAAFLGGRAFRVREPVAGSAEMLDLPAPLFERIILDQPALDELNVSGRIVETSAGRFVPYGMNLFAMSRCGRGGEPKNDLQEFADIMFGNAGPAYMEIYNMFADGLNRMREGKGADPGRFGDDACCFRMRAADYLALMDQAEMSQINDIVDRMLATPVPIRCVENMERLREHIGYVRMARRALLAMRAISESVLAGNPEQTLKAREDAGALCDQALAYLGTTPAAGVTWASECARKWAEMREKCVGPSPRKQD
ncbi:MAG TPA: hypothetical protein PL033_02980 [Candidatus Brocadiia bacterium]|nr:hypothetical protein [Candidatus Brocadiia bacterium]